MIYRKVSLKSVKRPDAVVSAEMGKSRTPESPRLPHSPRRGDIWFARLGDHPGTSVQDGCRPVLIVSNNTSNATAYTLNVLPMTSKLKKPKLPCHTLLECNRVCDASRGLENSMLLAEQITTIAKSQLMTYVGRVEDTELLARINHAISVQLGLR